MPPQSPAPSSTAMRPEALLFVCWMLMVIGWVKFSTEGQTVYIIDWIERVILIGLTWSYVRVALIPPRMPASAWDWPLALGGAYLLVKFEDLLVWLPAFFIDFTYPTFGLYFPSLDPGGFWLIDLTVGLALVAISEEVIFRKLFAVAWQANRLRPWSLYVVSSLAFAAIHLPRGGENTAEAFLWGLFLMYVYRRSGSLLLPVVVHYLSNVWMFSKHLVPQYSLEPMVLCDFLVHCVRP